MTIPDPKTLVRQFTQAHNQKDKAILGQLLATDFVSHLSDWPAPLTKAEYLHAVDLTLHAFSDLTFTIDDRIEEGEKVVTRLTAQGKHTGEYQGIQPTGMDVEFTGIAIHRIVNGLIVEEWQTTDQLGLLEQLGVSFKITDKIRGP